MAKILDGKILAQKIKLEIKQQVANISKRKPKLAVIVIGDDLASQMYVRTKIKACQTCGIQGQVIALDKSINQTEVINHIERLNNDNTVDGILVQLPLPKHLDMLAVINTITINKDVDGLTNINAGRLLQGDKQTMLPCTVKGILELLTYYQILIKRQNVTIINDSNIVGKPLGLLLNNMGATISVVHKLTKDLFTYTKNADIICTATGVHNIINNKQIKPGATIIDIAINYTGTNKKLVGDVDFMEMAKIAGAITPVPGGVGPMTIAMLLTNLMICYELNNK
ncbi:bifunctional 5,10-methylenetetrahydrofolate dehydrogenase/5,10-methenyltetrahydrofolate cyclohydrolase [Spiroplasma endosymbiont of Virgichneumon dumeticola]|uniref:bifunctional 5,10-methylenetetrahydrofolate dehydrogenase/5,10-methenyltetrahydrofolate cyclohydrolase n=1 Tax=Spiroplasma endosymbiont of Virgichneumon dumeticola TaxID=3139323 RepID=UPI0035C8F569